MVRALVWVLLRAWSVFFPVLFPDPVHGLFAPGLWDGRLGSNADGDEGLTGDRQASELLQLILSDLRHRPADRERRHTPTTGRPSADHRPAGRSVLIGDGRVTYRGHKPDNVPQTTAGTPSYQQQPPPDCILKLDLEWPHHVEPSVYIDKVQTIVANVLNLPEHNVHLVVDKTGHLKLFVVKPGAERQSHSPSNLLRASDAGTRSEASQRLSVTHQSGMTDYQARSGVSTDMQNYHMEFWQQPYFLVIVTVAATILMGAVFLVIWCCIRRKEAPEKSPFPSQQSSLLSAPIPQQICLFPPAKPSVNNATAIQPDADVSHVLNSTNKSAFVVVGTPVRLPGTPMSGSSTGSPIYSSSSTSGTPIPGTPVHTPPLRIKARGLLERRGSNASLTIELGTCASDSSHMGSPPKESTAEEYLLSAGNRMSRKQLQRCLYNVKAIYEEFWDIPMNHPDKIALPGSGIKNRYRTIIPNERTRVILPEINGDPISTYINANYIRGYGGEPKAYIATQGPMSNTVIDLWRMVWYEKAPIIVMITKLKEKNKNKCECYVPEFHDTFGDIDVHVEGITEKEGYIVRNIRLRHHGEEHEVLHYWYTAWPDHKAPNTARQLLKLVKEVDIQRRDPVTKRGKGPVIVHCSAGIGRTGCFIATSIGIQQLQREHMVDVLGIVCSMRLDRGGMVQTNEQYEFVHQALMLYERELPDRPSSDQ